MPATLQQAKERFQEAAFSRVGRYEEGTKGKGSAWENAKQRAETNWKPAIQEALQNDAYAKGLDKADGGDYDRGVRDKGVNNWPVGMQAGADKYSERTQKFEKLWGDELPTPQGPRRSAANIKRMTENVTRFVQASGK